MSCQTPVPIKHVTLTFKAESLPVDLQRTRYTSAALPCPMRHNESSCCSLLQLSLDLLPALRSSQQNLDAIIALPASPPCCALDPPAPPTSGAGIASPSDPPVSVILDACGALRSTENVPPTYFDLRRTAPAPPLQLFPYEASPRDIALW